LTLGGCPIFCSRGTPHVKETEERLSRIELNMATM